MNHLKKQKVLFICTANSARSQMAEALLRHKAGDIYDVYSAGTHPEEVDIRAINALKKFGLDGKGLVSKNLSVFENQVFDYVITLCEKASGECRSYPNAKRQLAWDIHDPKQRSGSNPFDTTLNKLNNRLSMFLSVEDEVVSVAKEVTSKSTDNESNKLTDFNPVSFYKSLTDDIRLKALMLTHYFGELCVCELMEAMEENSQPKMSRNLAVLRNNQVITDRKHGQWVFYRINPNLPLWAKSVIAETTENNIPLIESELKRLSNMANRPTKASFRK